MNRPLIMGLVGGVIVVVAIAMTFFVDRGGDSPAEQQAQRQGSSAAATAPGPNGSAPPLAAPDAVGKPLPPSFDVVRVNPHGDAVIAGRAEPNAEVTVRDGTREIGRVQADPRGEWVLVPKQPLAPGSRELNLTAENPKGSTATSAESVVVVVPERGKDISGRPAAEAGALAMRVPSAGGIGSTILQKPGGDAAIGMPAAAAAPSSSASPASGRGASAQALTLDAVDYDDAGRLALSGRGADGARVQLYLDNRLLGAGHVGKDGIWRVAPTGAVPPGLYTLRVDQLDGAGKVAARLETRFVRAEPLGTLPRDAVVFVQPGNSLWRLSRHVYGKGMQYTVIYEANKAQIRDPDLIYPGQVFMVPRVN